ncbi:MAG: hypothetical protein AAFX58_08970 [Pseudomonadota bacterium]
MTARNRFITLALTAIGALLSLPGVADDYRQTDTVTRIADGEPVGTASTLRTKNRLQSIVRTTDLDPGSVVTVWWRVYNRPQHCAIPYACNVGDLANKAVDGSQLHGTAFTVSESDGSALIVASLYRTAARAQGGPSFGSSLTEGYLSGRGLRRPLHADAELVLVSHGRRADPAIDGDEAAAEQLLTPGGTSLDCADPGNGSPARTYRCGALQIVNLPPAAGN